MPDARRRRPESGGEGPEHDDEWSEEIIRDYAMIPPVRLNLNEDVLTVTDFVFVSVSRRGGALFGHRRGNDGITSMERRQSVLLPGR